MKTKAKSRLKQRSFSLVFLLFVLGIIYLTAQYSDADIFELQSQSLFSMQPIEDFTVSRVIEFVVEMVSYSL